MARKSKLLRLLADADDAMASLDRGVKALYAEQETLSGSLGKLGAELHRQITGMQMTQQAFAEKCNTLREERKALLRRLEELDMNIAQLEQEGSTCAAQERQLREQLQGTTAHFERMIAVAVHDQKAMADEKLQAVSYKECANLALDVVGNHAQGRGRELAEQLRRNRAELERTLALYLRIERLRIEAACECLGAASPALPEAGACHPSSSPGGSHGGGGAREASASAGAEWTEVEAVAREAWQESQRVLKCASKLLSIDDSMEPAAVEREELGEGPDGVEHEACDGGGGAAQEEDPARRPEEAREFLAQARGKGQQCIDCGTLGAEWASVSHGTYLCTECAGKHRGLGVHLSFVRSTTMDRWSAEQLRRMQLGGNARFQEFIAGYPGLCTLPTSPEDFTALYSSRAAAFYRRRLAGLADGRVAAAALEQEPAPPTDEGHLPAVMEVAAGGSAPHRGSSSSASAGDEGRAGGSGEVRRTFVEEQAALEAAHSEWRRLLLKLQGGRSPAGA